MNDTARREPGGDGVARWFAGAPQGDPGAVDGLVRAVFLTARLFAARSCASREDAEDAVQDALAALVRRVGALRAAEAVTSWLFVTIRRSCLRRVPGVVLVPIDVAGDLAVDRTARQLGIGVRAAKSRLHRARRVLATVIGQPELRRSA